MKIRIGILSCIVIFCSVNIQGALIAYWPLNEGAGQILSDASGFANDGVLGPNDQINEEDPTWQTEVTDGNGVTRGPALTFNSVERDFVELSPHVSDYAGLNQGTISAWFKTTGTSAHVILAASDSSDASSEVRFFIEYNTLIYDVRDDSSDPLGEAGNIQSAAGVNDNNWHHGAITVDASNNATLYLDGLAVASGTEPFFNGVLGLNKMAIGRNVDSGGAQWHFTGSLGDIRIYDEVLAPSQISQLYEQGFSADVSVAETDGGTIVTESGVQDTFDVVLISEPNDSVAITLTPDTNGGDIELAGSAGPGQPLTLYFTELDWDIPQTVTVAAVRDSEAEELEVASISFEISSNDINFNNKDISPIQVTVINSGGTGCPPGDADGDCKVNLPDLAFMLDSWLNQDCFSPGCPVDLDGIAGVDLRDYQLLAGNWLSESPTLIISEILASNSGNLADEDGDYSDWIEIHNQSGMIINLGGYYLTDDENTPAKWIFPDWELLPGESLVVFASGKNRSVSGSELHTNFKLDIDGEFLALVKPDGQTISHGFTPAYPTQREDISFGVYENQERYFIEPTPAASNNQGFLGFVGQPEFSRDHGFYEDPISVALSTDTPDAVIKYTTDNSTPSETNGEIYTQPISISSTTALRAVAFKAEYIPTEVITSSYIYLSDVLSQPANPAGYPQQWETRESEYSQTIGTYQADFEMDPEIVNHPEYGPQLIDALKSLPTISLVTDIENLFDLNTGIYVHAVEPTGNLYGDTAYDWQRPTSVEMIYPDGQDGFQLNAALRMQGSASRRPANPKHSFRLLFKKDYGPGRLRYPLFGDDATDSINTLVLRGGFNDSYTIWADDQRAKATFLSDQFARDTHLAMGNPAAHGNYVHLYVNGLYWGLYNPSERPDAAFQVEYLGGQEEDYDVIKHRVQVIDGNTDAWNAAIAMAGAGLSSSTAYENIQQYIDVQSNADYMLLNFYAGTTDWPGNNWYMARNTAAGTGFKFFIWDAEQSLKSATIDQTGVNDASSPAYFYDKLRANEEYRVLFGDRAHKFLFNNGALTASACQQRYIARKDQIQNAIIAETARWGDAHKEPPYSLNDNWLPNVNNVINNIFTGRADTLLDQLRGKALYPDVDAPVFLVNGSYQHGGYMTDGDQLWMATQSGSYQDEELVAEGALVQAHVPIDNTLGLNWTQIAFVPDSSWTDGSTGTGVGFERGSGYGSWINTDVENDMYNVSTSVYCRIEFNYDGSPTYENLELHMKYDDGFIAYLNGTEVYRSGNITNDIPGSAAAASHEAGSSFEVFDISSYIHLLATGPNVLALHGINTTKTSSDMLLLPKLVGGYVTAVPLAGPVWYTTDGSDPRLPGGAINSNAQEYTGPITLTRTSHVKARTLDNGSWSALNEAVYALDPVAENLRISEIMYHPADPNTEFIELQNISTTETINLNLVGFTSGVDLVFGDTALNPGQYALVVQDQNAFEAKYETGLNIAGQYIGRLGNDGDRIELQDAIGTVIHNFNYEDNWYELTDGVGFSLTMVNPTSTEPNDWNSKFGWRSSLLEGGTPGQSPESTLAADSIVINELLAHSHGVTPDWIELHNTTGQDINISGWFLSDNDSDPNMIRKYEIPDNTIVPQNGYRVFYEDTSFGDVLLPAEKRFGLSEGGETAYLYSGHNGEVTGYYQTQQKFNASEADISFGRYEKPELSGGYDFTRMDSKTPGNVNSGPKIADIIITEIYYHPPNGSDYEYVELYNSGSPVTLMSEVTNETSPGIFITEDIPWRLEGTGFEFPAGVTINSGEYIIVAKNPAMYSSLSCDVYGPYDGKLDNGGEEVEIQMPGDQEFGKERFWIPIEKIDYDDVAPWPVSADGGGDSLHRLNKNTYGRDYSNWAAATPSPGQ